MVIPTVRSAGTSIPNMKSTMSSRRRDSISSAISSANSSPTTLCSPDRTCAQLGERRAAGHMPAAALPGASIQRVLPCRCQSDFSRTLGLCRHFGNEPSGCAVHTGNGVARRPAPWGAGRSQGNSPHRAFHERARRAEFCAGHAHPRKRALSSGSLGLHVSRGEPGAGLYQHASDRTFQRR
ncbi:hypothetical protein AJ87_45295 [Rhizobium yanglingense]|nr:hypothetical protein AJ87_45295 [Rhizobium yanglingense]